MEIRKVTSVVLVYGEEILGTSIYIYIIFFFFNCECKGPKWKQVFNIPLEVKGNDTKAAAKSLQSCPILCDPIDGSPPGSPVPGILQARTLEQVAISFSNA